MITKLSKEDVLELIAQSSLEELLKINREISIEIARIKLILIQTYIYGHSAEFYTKALAAAQELQNEVNSAIQNCKKAECDDAEVSKYDDVEE
jgi:hypothetical protein